MNLIIGRKPVLEAINSGEEIEQVYLLYGQRGGIIDAIRVAARKRGIKCNEISVQKFWELSSERSPTNKRALSEAFLRKNSTALGRQAPSGNELTIKKNTQGVIAAKSARKFYTLEEIILHSKKFQHPLLLALDSIQDTHNLGAILRTAECSEVHGVIITKHNSAPVNETVVKTSAGATEHLRICQVNNLVNALNELKKNGFWIVGSSLENSRSYNETDYKIPLALVLGNEEKGIRRLTAENCDVLIKIPMKGKIQSLNVSVAAGILLFEILRQRSL